MAITTTDFEAAFTIAGGATLRKALDLSSAVDQIALGAKNFTAISLSLAYGTGSSQGNCMWHDKRTITAGSNDDLDLSGVLANAFDAAIAFTKIKLLLIDIDSPDGTKSLQVGPQNVSNGWATPWGGGGATVYETVFTTLYKPNPYGWTVTAGTGDILRINNPGAGSVDYRIALIGVAT